MCVHMYVCMYKNMCVQTKKKGVPEGSEIIVSLDGKAYKSMYRFQYN